ncbi:MAG TPA: RnfABCDGE type electron transport complex subunit A [Candidatus Aminicenantes bacterium]|nr:RnfABCDGE type electron transport complex subunit A [Candidatus Aminicenantes bacterium]HPS99415.1 RnfABCDGE type electron transport complex subunit A [Candidatus Aminicenantes bacterium]
MTLVIIFVSALLINNFVLAQFLGICSFIGISNNMTSSVSMGMAVTFVMVLTAVVCWPIYFLVLVPAHLEFLQTLTFILVVACLVQFVEMFIKKTSIALYDALGIYLPLITTNCAILGFALIAVTRNYSYLETIVYGVGSGLGYTLAMVLMAGVRGKLETADIPKPLQGPGIVLITAGIMALAFMGFAGLIK